MVFIGLLTALLITITMVDVLDDTGNVGGGDKYEEQDSTGDINDDKDNNVDDNDNSGNSNNATDNGDDAGSDGNQSGEDNNTENSDIINATGTTLSTRINAPAGYVRISAEQGSLGSFLRDYAMKEHNAKVLLYDGSEKNNQTAHAGIFMLPLENKNLQQYADSIMRVYAEYYLSTKQYEKIVFSYSDGFKAEYAKWIEGNGINVKDGKAKWVKNDKNNNTYESFQEYMRLVFAYAGIWSMKDESSSIELKDAQIGDVFFATDDGGRVAMIVDICQNADGKKAYLLASGGKPAQEFVLLNNPLHTDDPWYYEDEIVYPLDTPEFDYKEGSIRRLVY